MNNKFLNMIIILGQMVLGALGGWDIFIKGLIGLMAIDFFVGSFQIYLDGWDKEKFFVGGIRKTILLCTIAGLVLIEPLTGIPYLRNFACIYWGIYEFKSILATGERFGIEPAIFIKKVLDSVLDKVNNFKISK